MRANVHRLEFGDGGGYQVVMGNGGKGRTLYFSDARQGSKRKAHKAAKDAADALNVLIEHIPELRLCKSEQHKK